MQVNKNHNASANRNSSIEVLRIIAMLMIVISHASVHGGFPEYASQVELNNHFLNWVILGNLGVNIFILITGYFFCTKQITVKGILKHLTQVWFYSILCCVIYLFAGGSVSVKDLLPILFPTIFKEYWFFTAYFVLILLSPYLNIFVKNASKSQFQACLLTMVILWCVILSFTSQDMYSSQIPQFVLYYLVGAYLRMHTGNYLAISKVRNCLAFFSLFLLFLSSTIIRLVNENFTVLISETSFTNPFSILSFGSSVGLFAIAAYHKPWTKSYINSVASCTFGIYLFHDNPFIRKLIWQDWIHNSAWYDSGFLIIRIILSALLVFFASLMIELLRQKIIAEPFYTFVETLYDTICKKINFIKSKTN